LKKGEEKGDFRKGAIEGKIEWKGNLQEGKKYG